MKYDISPIETNIIEDFVFDSKFILNITINDNILENSIWVVSDYINININNNNNLEKNIKSTLNISINYNLIQTKSLEHTFTYSDYFFIRSLQTNIIKENTNKYVCIVCNKNNTESYFYPCGHKCICDICYIKIKSNKIKKKT